MVCSRLLPSAAGAYCLAVAVTNKNEWSRHTLYCVLIGSLHSCSLGSDEMRSGEMR